MNSETVYRLLPVGLQHLACSLEGWRIRRGRYNADFRERLAAAEERAKLSPERMAAFRDDRLRAFVRHAATSVPYWRELFRRTGIDPGDIRGLGDLGALPVLTKAQIQQDPDAFRSDAVPRGQLVGMHTSGTTGAGLHFSTTAAALREQYAIWWRHLRRHGLRQGEWCAYFAGRSIVPAGQSAPPFWRVNSAGRQVLFSAYHLNGRNALSYLEELRRRRILWIHGYPSFIAQIAERIVESGFDLGYQLRWITTSSENLHAHQARLIESAFGVAPVQNYGMTEAVANISQAPDGNLYVDEDYCAVEFLPTGEDGVYKVVGTNFSNPATPLIRYDTGDIVRLSGSGGGGFPGRAVAGIDGRQEDYLLLPNGVRIGRLDHIFKDMVNVREAQILQREVGVIEVLVVRGARYTQEDEAAMLREFRTRLSGDIAIGISYVDTIEKTRSGKLRFVVSSLDRGGGPA